jgi:hypothetical protein
MHNAALGPADISALCHLSDLPSAAPGVVAAYLKKQLSTDAAATQEVYLEKTGPLSGLMSLAQWLAPRHAAAGLLTAIARTPEPTGAAGLTLRPDTGFARLLSVCVADPDPGLIREPDPHTMRALVGLGLWETDVSMDAVCVVAAPQLSRDQLDEQILGPLAIGVERTTWEPDAYPGNLGPADEIAALYLVPWEVLSPADVVLQVGIGRRGRAGVALWQPSGFAASVGHPLR